MTINEIKDLLSATVLCCDDKLTKEVHTACGNNPQVVRTAEMMDIICICFVRGKQPDKMLIDLASEKGIVLMTTETKMFEACGILYEKGLRGGADK